MLPSTGNTPCSRANTSYSHLPLRPAKNQPVTAISDTDMITDSCYSTAVGLLFLSLLSGLDLLVSYCNPSRLIPYSDTLHGWHIPAFYSGLHPTTSSLLATILVLPTLWLTRDYCPLWYSRGLKLYDLPQNTFPMN